MTKTQSEIYADLKMHLSNRVYANVGIICSDHPGFYTSWKWEPSDRYPFAGAVKYTVHIPRKKLDRWGKWSQKTLLHEIGHIVWNNAFYGGQYHKQVPLAVSYMKEKEPRFCKWQRIWYWNKFLRWIKRVLGFAIKLEYGPDDLYDEKRSDDFTCEDVELFCDYYAIHGNILKEMQDLGVKVENG